MKEIGGVIAMREMADGGPGGGKSWRASCVKDGGSGGAAVAVGTKRRGG